MSYKYSKLNYNNVVSLLNDYSYPNNDCLIEIFCRYENDDNIEFCFNYSDEGNTLSDSLYQVLSLHDDMYNVERILCELSENGIENFYPFAITENGSYLGITDSNDGEENLKLYITDLNIITDILDENMESITTNSFLDSFCQ